MTETMHLVERQTSAGDALDRTQIRAAQIDHDRKKRSGHFRQDETVRCPACVNESRRAGAIATIYVGPGGVRIAHLPPRVSSSGPEARSVRLPALALTLQELTTGVCTTQCRTCRTYFALTALNRAGVKDPELNVVPVVRTTFGAVQETGEPTLVHEVPLVGPMLAWHRHAMKVAQQRASSANM